MKLQNYSTEKLQLKIDELREELFARQFSDSTTFPKYNESKDKWIWVESINTMQVSPTSKTFYVGIDDYQDQQITIVFPIDKVIELTEYLATKPNWKKLNKLTKEDIAELPKESFQVLNDIPPKPFPRKDIELPEPCTAEEFEQTLKDLISSGATISNWSEDKDIDPIMYELPSNPTYPKFTIEPIKTKQELVDLQNEFKDSKYQVSSSMMFSIYKVSRLDNPHTFELLVNDEGENLNDILPDIENFQVIIDYPLETPVLVKFGSIKNHWGEKEYNNNTLGYILWQVSQAYLEIYQNYTQHGIYGHSINDLYFEGVYITEKGNVTLFIGS